MTVGELCRELNNWFTVGIYFDGGIVIQDGQIQGLEGRLQENQYFRICDSIFNDGVYQYPAYELVDENPFDGVIWAMAVPPAVIALADEITDWQNKYGAVINSPYQSESFGGYSYTKASGNRAGDSNADVVTWQSQFASRLNKWRKI